MDDLLRILVPLGIFAFWAITKLSEKGVKPLEQRGPNLPPQQRTVDALILRAQQQQKANANMAARQPTLRWSNQVAGSNRPDEEIIILGEGRPARQVPTQRKQSPRQKQGGGNKSANASSKPARSRGSVDLNQGVSQRINETLSITPLSVSTSPMHIQAGSTTSHAAKTVSLPEMGMTLTLRERLTDPARVREAIVINEILQPPLALRRQHKR